MTLEEVRKNIDRVDGKIRELFIERMGLADQDQSRNRGYDL